MKKRFYFTVLVLAVILLALPGLTGKGVRRVTRHRRCFPAPTGVHRIDVGGRLSS